jgi:hypothetical protein
VRVLSKEQFATYATTQIEMAEQILAIHRPGANGWCSCGKQLPCSVSQHATTTRDRYRAQLAVLDSTVILPVLAPAAEARPVPLWRRLIGGLQ